MNKWLKIGTLATVVAVVALMALGAVSAFAQGPAPANPPAFGRALGLGPGFGGRFGEPQNSLVAVAAKELGIDQTALVAELNTGKTIADVAKAKNVSADKIANAFAAPHTQALKATAPAWGGSLRKRRRKRWVARSESKARAGAAASFGSLCGLPRWDD
jgi:hypothetical protein